MADYDSNHMVWVSGNRDDGGSFRRGDQGRAELEGAFENLAGLFRRDDPTVVLHFHGGITPAETGIAIAHRLIHGDATLPNPPFAPPQTYCLSFIWETLLETAFPLQMTPGERPFGNRRQAWRQIEQRIAQRIGEGRAHSVCLKEGGDCQEDQEDPRKNTQLEEMVRVFYKNIVGEKWARMKDNARKSFLPGNPGHAVLQHLQALAETLGRNPRVVLVAQSAGSIYVCRLVEAARELAPDLEFEVILTAPACTIDLFQKTILARQECIRDFRMFALSDALEKRDVMLKAVPAWLFDYRSSILYFVSGALEPSSAEGDPAPDQGLNYEGDAAILGMQRFYTGRFADGSFPELTAVQNFMRGKVIWSGESVGAERETESIYHAAFESDPKTLISLRRMLHEGFRPPGEVLA